jgi:hypothetical protein
MREGMDQLYQIFPYHKQLREGKTCETMFVGTEWESVKDYSPW